jgi:hypothetical protein
LTSPTNSTTSDEGRTYVWPPTGEVFTSVTTILNVLSKPFLTKWAAKMAAEYAVENWGELTDMLIRGEQQDAVTLIKEASSRSAQESSEMGTYVHSSVEERIKGIPSEISPIQLVGFDAWREVHKPEFILCESTVYNRTEGYAGTMDFMAEIEGRNIIVDVKTGKQVYPEVALQLCAYAHGEWCDEGTGREAPLPRIDGAAVLHLRPRGYKFIPVRIDEEVWRSFQYVKEAFRWQRYTSKRVLGFETPMLTTTEW